MKLILADMHHEDLYESLVILFEDRLKFQLYRPVGLEWYREGYWKVYNHPTTAEQYLAYGKHSSKEFSDRQKIEDNFRRLSDQNTVLPDDTLLVKSVTYPERLYRAVPLEVFKNMTFDILLCSMPAHVEPFLKLQRNFQPQAKLIFQIGNNWPPPPQIKNFLCSSRISAAHIPADSNSVFYHQEFNAEAFRDPSAISMNRNPYSVTSMTHYMQDKPLFLELEKRLPRFTFQMKGAGNRDGPEGPQASKIRAAFHRMGFLLHIKPGGDGFGYNLMNAAAAGVPIICKKKQFTGMTAERLLIDGKTCINLNGLSLDGAANQIEEAAQNYEEWKNNMLQTFYSLVNFDKEFGEIQTFLNNLR